LSLGKSTPVNAFSQLQVIVSFLVTPSAAPAKALVASAASTCGVFTWTRFVHGKVEAMQCRPVKLAGGILCFLFRGHGHEGEAPGLARRSVLHKDGFANSAGSGEKVQNIIFCGVEGKIPDIKFSCHYGCVCLVEVSLCGCFR
jgi:hypothetical protein